MNGRKHMSMKSENDSQERVFVRDAKFDYDATMARAERAQREIDSWPAWKQRAARAVFVSQPDFERADAEEGPSEAKNS